MIDRQNSYGVRVIVQREDKYLLVQHNQTLQYPGDIRDPEKVGLWSFPGGHFEGNEAPEQAVERELYEEFKLKVSDIIYVDELIYKDKKYLVYQAQTNQEINYYDPKEIDDYRWFTFAEIKEVAKAGLEHTGQELRLLEKSIK